MKKVFGVLLALIICFTLFSGCNFKHTEDPENTTDPEKITDPENTEKPDSTDGNNVLGKGDQQLSLLRKSILGSNCSVGIAFIGYVSSVSSQEELREYLESSPVCLENSFLSECPIIANEGQELYAIVPTGKEDRITVFEAGISEDGEYEFYRDNIVFAAEPGEPIVLRCNLSEIYSDVLISVDISGDGKLEFSPFLSMKDGHIATQEGCFDFSEYGSDEDARIQAVYGLLTETDEVQYHIDQGMTLQCMYETQDINGSECLIFALGTEQGDTFVREFLYAASSDGNMYVFDSENNAWLVLSDR